MAKRIVLSFDNGPHAVGTQQLLQVLAKRSLTATFFLVGSNLQVPPSRELAMHIRDAGHRIGNHTFTHGIPLGRRPGREVAEREIGETQALLAGLSSERLFRPNGEKGQLGPHLLSQDACRYLQEQRFTVVTWNCVPADWIPPDGSWVARAQAIMRAQDWTAIVLHDHRLATGMHPLEHFLDTLIAQGYEFTNEFPPETVLMRNGQPTEHLPGHHTA